MHNPYVEYFRTQAGTGLTGFQGIKHQRGHGFFGRIFSKAVYPLLRFLGKQAITTGANLASDVFLDKKNIKDAAKDRLNEAAEDIVKAGVKRAKTFAQDGEGRRKLKIRRKTTKKSIKRRKRRTKSKNFKLFDV